MKNDAFPNYEIPVSTPIIFDKIENRSDDFVKYPHRHKFYEILWIKEGKGDHIVDFISYPIKNNSIIFLTPGKVHQLDTKNKKGFLLVFTQDFLSQILSPLENNFFSLFYPFDNIPFIFPSKKELHKLNIMFELIIHEYKNEPYDPFILQTHLKAFLLHSQRIKIKKETVLPEKNHEILIQLFRLIEIFYKKEKSTSFYADKLNFSLKNINKITKIRLGKTVIRLLHDRLILEAKRELFFGKQNIKEIAYILGFNDPAYFTRFFKKETKITPDQFKSEMVQIVQDKT